MPAKGGRQGRQHRSEWVVCKILFNAWHHVPGNGWRGNIHRPHHKNDLQDGRNGVLFRPLAWPPTPAPPVEPQHFRAHLPPPPHITAVSICYNRCLCDYCTYVTAILSLLTKSRKSYTSSSNMLVRSFCMETRGARKPWWSHKNVAYP